MADRPFILLVDDEPDAWTPQRTALVDAGFDVATARDAAEAVNLAVRLWPL